jgi:biopolymer transport protein ExbB
MAFGRLDRSSSPPPTTDINMTPRIDVTLMLLATFIFTAALEARLTRRLRDALHRGLAHLQFGQVILASIGSTAPFVGLFGTVWAIHHALTGIGDAGTLTIEKVAGPVGEALVMTAAGIAVAVPAVLAYNAFGKLVAACEAELEGFAHDLRRMVLDTPRD